MDAKVPTRYRWRRSVLIIAVALGFGVFPCKEVVAEKLGGWPASLSHWRWGHDSPIRSNPTPFRKNPSRICVHLC